VEYLLLFTCVLWPLLAFINAMFLDSSPETRLQGTQIIGGFGSAFGLLYYFAPLSTLHTVIKEKDSSSIYLPTIFVNMVNATCWVIYGLLGVKDVIVWGPNAVGLLIGTTQAIIGMSYPRKREKERAKEMELEELAALKLSSASSSALPAKSKSSTKDDKTDNKIVDGGSSNSESAQFTKKNSSQNIKNKNSNSNNDNHNVNNDNNNGDIEQNNSSNSNNNKEPTNKIEKVIKIEKKKKKIIKDKTIISINSSEEKLIVEV